MSAVTLRTPENCRAMAVECGRRANEFVAIRQYAKAGKELTRARELTLLALELEQADKGAR